jgi:hypothetical protein
MALAHSPRIVTDGLVLCLDAGNLKGYDKYENLVNNSETFENWTANGSRATITSNQIFAPDGSLTADMIEDANSNSGFKNLYQYITITSTETYTASLYVKAGTSDWANFYFDDTNVSFQFSTETLSIDPNSGNLGGTGTATAGFDNLGNGWYRLYLKDIYASSGSRPFGIWTGAGTQTYNPSYVGDPTKNFYIWGAQLERGSSVTDYYATTSTTKIRGTSWTDLSGNGNNGTLTNGPTYSNSNGGSIVFDGTNDYIVRNSTTINLSAGVTMEMIFKSTDMNSRAQGFMQYNASGGYYINFYTPGNGRLRWETWVPVSVAGGAFYTPTALSNNTWYHAVGTYSSGSSKLYINGINVSSASQTSGTYSSSYTGNLQIGQYAGYMSGNVAIAKIYNRVLTAEEVQQNFNALRSRFGI